MISEISQDFGGLTRTSESEKACWTWSVSTVPPPTQYHDDANSPGATVGGQDEWPTYYSIGDHTEGVCGLRVNAASSHCRNPPGHSDI